MCLEKKFRSVTDREPFVNGDFSVMNREKHEDLARDVGIRSRMGDLERHSTLSRKTPKTNLDGVLLVICFHRVENGSESLSHSDSSERE